MRSTRAIGRLGLIGFVGLTSCINPEVHRQALSANEALKGQIAAGKKYIAARDLIVVGNSKAAAKLLKQAALSSVSAAHPSSLVFRSESAKTARFMLSVMASLNFRAEKSILWPLKPKQRPNPTIPFTTNTIYTF